LHLEEAAAEPWLAVATVAAWTDEMCQMVLQRRIYSVVLHLLLVQLLVLLHDWVVILLLLLDCGLD